MSEYLSNYIVSDFEYDPKKIIVTGLPKHDVLSREVRGAEIDSDEELAKLLSNITKKNPDRIILYGPTYRPNGTVPFQHFGLQKINDALKRRNDFLIMALHPKFSTRDWIPETDLDHIYFSQGDMDKYPLLDKFDLLVTDYSSLALDFLYMKKPIILFAYDYEQYKKEMGLYQELWDIMPAPKTFTPDELIEALEKDLSVHQKDIEKINKKLFAYTDGQASKRIVSSLFPVR